MSGRGRKQSLSAADGEQAAFRIAASNFYVRIWVRYVTGHNSLCQVSSGVAINVVITWYNVPHAMHDACMRVAVVQPCSYNGVAVSSLLIAMNSRVESIDDFRTAYSTVQSLAHKKPRARSAGPGQVQSFSDIP